MSDMGEPPAPRRLVAACLLLVGATGVAFAAWRLGVWAVGRPDQLLDIGDTQAPRLLAEGEADLARARRAVEAARAGGAADPQAVAAAEGSLRVRERSQAALAAGWDLQVRQARRGEAAYTTIGALVGGYGLWAGGRRLRARRPDREGPPSTG